MTTHHAPRRRGGFSLIELLVVIAIIGILMGLTTAAVQKFRAAGPEVQTAADIRNLEMAIEGFKGTFSVDYIPAGFVAAKDYTAAPFPRPPVTYPSAAYPNGSKLESAKYVKQVWGRPNMADTGWQSHLPDPQRFDDYMDANQSLVFFLSGAPLAIAPNSGPLNWADRTGFSPAPRMFTKPSVGGQGFMEFPANRVDAAGHYLDPYGSPYCYFTSKTGNDYNSPSAQSWTYPLPDGSSTTVTPYMETVNKFYKASSFQIISAGANKKFGPGGLNYTPGLGAYSQGGVGGDDLSNLATRKMVSAR